MNDFVYDANGEEVYVGDVIWYAKPNSRGTAELVKATVTKINEGSISVTAHNTVNALQNGIIVNLPDEEQTYKTSIGYSKRQSYRSSSNKKILKYK